MHDEKPALAWINQVRANHDYEPLTSLPRGGPPAPGRLHVRSPVEVALNVKVTLGRLQAHTPTRIVFLQPPDSVIRFIDDYRRGGYPHLHPPERRTP
jgi:hypothetical protein